MDTRRQPRTYRRREKVYQEGDTIDYKDVDKLRKLLTERGKILPRAKTRLTAKQQRTVSVAIKRARYMALLPYTVKIEA